MYNKNVSTKCNFLICIVALVCAGCTHSVAPDTLHTHKQGVEYTIKIPNGWREVIKESDVKKHVFWGFTNSNYSKFKEQPLFRAWDAPEAENAFCTLMEVKRHRNLGVGGFYNQVVFMMREQGWDIQETGTTQLGGERSKWWIQTHLNGALQQQCYLFAHGEYVYALAFSTSYLSEKKQKLFKEIAESISFQAGA